MAYLLAILGLIILIVAGDFLVRGAVNLSLRLGIPAFIVSLTIVAFGTSAPELLISVSAVLSDQPGLALGNVVGSNIANVLLVLGVPAMIAGLHTSEIDTKKNFALMLVATGLFIAACFLGPISWMHGIFLLATLAYILWIAVKDAQSHKQDFNDVESANPDLSGKLIALFLVLGFIGLPLGAEILVRYASIIARDLGVSETIIGLTLVAFGTSAPELATTITAAIRRQADVALGNVIGSNMFNLLAVTGIASLFGSMTVPLGLMEFDIWVLAASSIVLIPFVYFRQDINRIWGVALTLIYVSYLVFLLN